MPRYIYKTIGEARHRKRVLDAGVPGQSKIKTNKGKGKKPTTYTLVIKDF